MIAGRKAAGVVLLLLVVFTGCLITSRSHWLLPRNGRVTCGGASVVGAKVYRSQRGDIFLYAPNVDAQLVLISPQSRELGRCNPAFTPVFGLLFSFDAEENFPCTSMWKGADSHNVEPPHVVTGTYAEFPWGSCPRLRIEY